LVFAGKLVWQQVAYRRLTTASSGRRFAPPLMLGARCKGSYLMLRLVALTSLAMCGVGSIRGGFFGALTGLLATLLIGTSLGVLFGDPQANVAPARSGLGIGQRAAALVAGALAITGAILGGWHWGWVWSLFGFLIGVTTVFAIRSSLQSRLSKIDDKVIGAVQFFLTEDERCKPLFPEERERKAAEKLITDRIVTLFEHHTGKESQRDAIRTESLKWKSIFDPQRVAAEGQGYMVETLRSAPLETRITFCVTRVAGWLFESEYQEPVMN